MQTGSYPETAAALVLETVVTVGGIVREHLSWSLEREISTDLPTPVLAGSGIVAATGRIEWAPTALDLGGQALTPWTRAAGWPPRPGDPVTVDLRLHQDFAAGGQPLSWRIFTGRIQETTGGIAEGRLTSTVIDGCFALVKRYEARARAAREPGATDGTWTTRDVSPQKWVEEIVYGAGVGAIRSETAAGDVPTWVALPYIDRSSVLDLLRELGQATGSAFFFDEFGTLNWLGRTALATGDPVRRLTSLDNLLDLGWVDTRAHVRRSVTVKGKSVVVDARSVAAYDVWRGSDGEMDDLHRVDMIRSPGDVDWYGVDRTLERVDDLGATGKRNTGSRVGAWTRSDGKSGADGRAGYGYRARATEIDSRTWRFEQWLDSLPPAGKEITLTAPDTSGAYKTDLAEQKGRTFPVLRARQRVRWIDDAVTSSIVGPGWAPDLEVDAGWMLQNDLDRKRFADAIAARVTAPHPVVEDVPIVPDPRLQLGDVVEIVDTHRSGLTIRAVIVGLRFDAKPGEVRQMLTCRVLAVTDVDVTLAVHDAAWSGMTLADLDRMLSGRTLAELDASPLRTS